MTIYTENATYTSSYEGLALQGPASAAPTGEQTPDLLEMLRQFNDVPGTLDLSVDDKYTNLEVGETYIQGYC